MRTGYRFALCAPSRWFLAGSISAGLMFSAAATAGHTADMAGLSFKAGTTGMGADLTFGIYENLNLRAGLNTFSFTFSLDEDDLSEDVTAGITLRTLPVLADWHPSGGNFRLSGGLVLNWNGLSLSAQPGDVIDFNDTEYEVESFSGELSFNRVCPYLGIGYGNATRPDRRFAFALDFGIMFHGTPGLSMRAEASDPSLQDDLDRDLEIELEELREDARPFKFFPVLTLGLIYRF